MSRRMRQRYRRAHALHLTAEGRRMLETATHIAGSYEEQLCARLSPKERESLLALLRKLAEGQELPVGVHPGLVADPGAR